MKEGLVSIIVPVYQAEEYLLRCVESVQQQTYLNWEIIFIDDGSTDNSLRICEKLAAQEKKIFVYHQENEGVAQARNRGLDYAKGEYIFFLDSDDWIDKDALRSMLEAIKRDCSDLCICGYQIMGTQDHTEYSADVNEYIDIKTFYEKFFWKLYHNTILFNIGTKLYKRELIEKYHLRFHTEVVIYEDIRFFLEYIQQIQTISLNKNIYYFYFKGNTMSITHTYKEKFWNGTFEYCQMLWEIFDNHSMELKKAILLCLYRAYLQECHRPKLNRKNFIYQMQKYCFSMEEQVRFAHTDNLGVSLDAFIFQKLISNKQKGLLWILAKMISLKK